jgi:hypothetical protein
MKLIDCTVYTDKPKDGIPGTIPGVYEGRAWRAQPDDHLSWSQDKLIAWARSLPKNAPVLLDVEPIFNTAEKLNFRDPITAYWQIADMLKVIRGARDDVKLWLYTGGRFWGYVDKREWNQHPQMLLRYVLVSRLYDQALCDGLAHEAYPPRWVKSASSAGDVAYDEDRTVETMGMFFARLANELAPWTNSTPIMPVLGTNFLSGQQHHTMPASTFSRVREQCARHFDMAMVWGGVEFNQNGSQKRLRTFAENAAFFEDSKPVTPIASTKPLT